MIIYYVRVKVLTKTDDISCGYYLLQNMIGTILNNNLNFQSWSNISLEKKVLAMITNSYFINRNVLYYLKDNKGKIMRQFLQSPENELRP